MSRQSSKSRGKIILKKNKTINKIWHPESTLVFKSPKEKLVIGRFQNGDVIPLDEEALDLCVQWKFKYDTSLVDEEEVTESDTGDEGEEPEPTPETVNKFKTSDGDPELKPVKEVPDPVKVSKKFKTSDEDPELKPVKEVIPEAKEVPDPVKVSKKFKTSDEDPELKPVKEVTPEAKEVPDPVKVSKKVPVPDLTGDNNLQVEVAFTNFNSELSLLRNNINKIISDVQNKAVKDFTALSKELITTKDELSTKNEALVTITKDFEETKAKLTNIRSALGF
jgi:hypothetical protein